MSKMKSRQGWRRVAESAMPAPRAIALPLDILPVDEGMAVVMHACPVCRVKAAFACADIRGNQMSSPHVQRAKLAAAERVKKAVR